MTSGVLLLLLLGVVFTVALKHRKKQKDQGHDLQGRDWNPVYGMYYFADRENIDESQSEVVDGNNYYE